ncbi:MAG: hypothetical protein LKF52_01345 [Butyrivibrio sp.]|nr:hypothetical protein [Butyrivibrio sp.]
MTAQMPAATYPVISMLENGKAVDTLHGYAQEMEVNYMHGTILPIGKNRQIQMHMQLFGTKPENLTFEVRTLDGTSLVESTKISDYREDDNAGTLEASFQLKDLIESDTEYMLVILADVNGKTVRYYTRIVWTEDDSRYHVDEKLNFVRTFHDSTFDKNKAQNLSGYLETNSEGDNSSFYKVDIHSSLDQVSWGALAITSHTDPEVFITDIHGQTASFRLDYQVTVTDDQKVARTYDVQESYRVRYTSDRIYLLDFQRTMDYVFEGSASDFSGTKLNLSISDPDLQMMESDGGGAFAFVSADRLYIYNVSDRKMARLFGFYNSDQNDVRTLWKNNSIRILSVDEAGNVEFLVSGYMDRGRHEGEVGTVVYNYNATVNTVEEKAFVSSTQSEEIVMAYAKELAYANQNDEFYMMRGDSVYAVNLNDRSWKDVIKNIVSCDYRISESGSMVVWQKNSGEDAMSSIQLMNMNTQAVSEITADSGDYIRPIGFMGEDLVYGLLHKSDIYNDQMGNPVYPMYSIQIRDKDGNTLENYHVDNMFVTDAEINDSQITLTRVRLDEKTKKYTSADADQIMSTLEAEAGSNTVVTANSDVFENIVEIALKSSSDENTVKLLTPSEILYEGSRDVLITEETEENLPQMYYTYGQSGIEGIYTDPAKAVSAADEISGVVVDDTNRYVWIKGNLLTKNQIMSITNAVTGKDLSGESSTTACLDLMLQNEGISQNVQAMLKKGSSVNEILSSSLSDAQILDLGGCSLSAALYYVNQDIPVLAMMNDGSSVLIIGFNDLNTVILDPEKKTAAVYKYGMKDSEELFEKNGNHFITYLMPQEDAG